MCGEIYMKILLATDGTKHSEFALEYFKIFNFASGDQIKIISVVDMAVPMAIDMYAGYLPSTPEIEKNLRENAERILDETCKRILEMTDGNQVAISSELLVGSPESRIVETAEEMEADLIIVGSHGYNRWERLLLGSVSDSVVHHAPCSVLVVRIPKE
jgi:nucleotide-binding universal stress UspA family protein